LCLMGGIFLASLIEGQYVLHDSFLPSQSN
jgi:hypothetical protein